MNFMLIDDQIVDIQRNLTHTYFNSPFMEYVQSIKKPLNSPDNLFSFWFILWVAALFHLHVPQSWKKLYGSTECLGCQ